MSTKQQRESTQSASPKKSANQASTKKSSPKKSSQPKAPKQKPISLKTVQKQEAQMNTYSTHIVNAETNEVIKYYEKFDQSKIRDLLVEAYEKLVYVQQNDEIDFFKNDEEFISYLQFLSIKFFTHFGDEIGDTFEDHISAMNTLISLGYFKLILNDLFDGNEVYGIILAMTEFVEAAGVAMENEIQEQQKLNEIKDNVESKFILKIAEDNG